MPLACQSDTMAAIRSLFSCKLIWIFARKMAQCHYVHKMPVAEGLLSDKDSIQSNARFHLDTCLSGLPVILHY